MLILLHWKNLFHNQIRSKELLNNFCEKTHAIDSHTFKLLLMLTEALPEMSWENKGKISDNSQYATGNICA